MADYKRRIAVIDDEASIGELLERILERDFDVSVYQDVESFFLDLDEGRRFDAILCDLYMEGETGGEIYEDMARRWPRLSRAMIFMSGATTAEIEDMIPRQAPHNIIEKPFDIQRLREMVRHVAESSSDVGRPEAE